ncbi:MAG: MerR family transcriptional regulator [Actinobacteria bacterium]|nr:MerR family transcriptional regulator [Actinomycetota bacterium]
MSTFVGSAEATRILGVRPETLYAYVSRGLIRRRVGPDGRRSLYDRDDIEALSRRGRSRTSPPRPSIDVQVTSAITCLDEQGPTFRGRPVVELAGTATFEQVAELLWTGELPIGRVRWSVPSAADRELAADVVAAVGQPGLAALAATSTALAERHRDDPPTVAARRLLTLAPLVVSGHGGGSGSTAQRLVQAWTGRADRHTVDAVDAVLVMLADHELTTSTLAARVAASVRPPAHCALAAGLSTMSGRLHGAAASQVVTLLAEAREHGAAAAIGRRLSASEPVPGFGHTIYKRRDPRFAPLMDSIAELSDPDGWRPTIAEVLSESGNLVPVAPNVDFALGALLLTARLPADVPLFAVARLAGLGAHVAEEMGEVPLRFRGLTRPLRT